MQIHSLCQCFSVIFSNHLASILQPYPIPYPEPWQKPKMESFLKIVVTAWKVSKYGVISGRYFPVLGLNTEIYGTNFRVQSECRKIQTRKNSVFGNFSRSVWEKNSILVENLQLFSDSGLWLLIICGYLVVTCGYMVATSGYLIATTGYFWLPLVTFRYFWFLVLVTTWRN